MEKFEYKGSWWLPEDPDRKVGGILKFSPDEGIRLELTDLLESNNHLSLGAFAPELIFGKTAEKGKVTLYHCLETRHHAATSEIVCELAILGSHVDFQKDTFLSMHAESRELDFWANFKWVELSDWRCVRWHIPDKLNACLNDGTRVALWAVIEHSWTSVPAEVRLRRKTFVEVTPASPSPFERCLGLLQTMLDLVSLGLLRPAIPSEIVGVLNPQEEKVEIVYKFPRKYSSNKALLNPAQTLFTCTDISNHFDEFIRRWFDLNDRLRPVLNLYLATLYAQEMYVESYFLNIIHALEAYHRLAIGGQDLPEDEHQKRVSEIINSAPSQWRQWLKEQLKYSNEKRLRSRLMEICEKSQSVTKKLIGSKKKVKHFISQVVDTRNYLTHYDPAYAEKAVHGRQLFYLTQRLKVLLECCLLRELGFPDPFILERIEKVSVNRLPLITVWALAD